MTPKEKKKVAAARIGIQSSSVKRPMSLKTPQPPNSTAAICTKSKDHRGEFRNIIGRFAYHRERGLQILQLRHRYYHIPCFPLIHWGKRFQQLFRHRGNSIHCRYDTCIYREIRIQQLYGYNKSDIIPGEIDDDRPKCLQHVFGHTWNIVRCRKRSHHHR